MRIRHSESERAWRKRLAQKIRRFKRIRGRWPVKGTVPALKKAIKQAVAQGMKVPTEH